MLLHKTAYQDRKSRKGFLFFCAHFWHFQKLPVLCRAEGDRKKFPLPFGKSAGCPWRAGKKKFSQISAYSSLCGFVRNREIFPQITVIFALHGVVGSRGRNIAAALAKSPLAALKVLREASTAESVTF
ncbi:hypothetical protein D7Y06_21470 [Roseburia sp. 1XD42-69]|nr:hypothetical protein D7Y06_21470 [Roseburia sp. 1XD42-69]